MNAAKERDNMIFLLSAAAAIGGETMDMTASYCRQGGEAFADAIAFVESVCGNPESRIRLAVVAATCGFTHAAHHPSLRKGGRNSLNGTLRRRQKFKGRNRV